ncbi:MAG: hypothetical protein V4577_04145 [Bacteroidota bacterium]
MNQSYRTRKSMFKKRITDYFKSVKGEFHLEPKLDKDGRELPGVTQKVWDREPAKITVAGLALALGFNSLDDFDNYLKNGEFAKTLQWGQLHIIADYEQKLQGPAATVFALKLMGVHEREPLNTQDDAENNRLIVEILESGPKPAGTEKEVIL